MTQTMQLLETIYKSAQMGIASIEHLAEQTEDSAFLCTLECQSQEYLKILMGAKDQIRAAGHEPIGLGRFALRSSELSVRLNVKSDNSISHYAQMMIEGSAIGIKKLARAMREASGCVSEQAYTLAETMLKTELNNVTALIGYL